MNKSSAPNLGALPLTALALPMTLDKSTANLISRLLEGKLRARRADLDRAIEAIKVDGVRRGVLYSSITEHAMKRAFRSELNERAKAALATVKEVFGQTGMEASEGLAQDLTKLLHDVIDQQTLELATRLSNELSGLALGGGDLAVQEERDHLRTEISAETDLYVATLGRQGSQGHSSETVAPDERDHLTQLLGRAAFDNVLGEQCARATADQPVSLILADIDHFKSINDTHGHPFGDAVLRDAADRFARVVQSKGLVFRYGGEEFAAVLANHTIEEAVAVAERTRLAMESARIKEVAVTCSFGVATAPIHASDPEQLLEMADRALYDSKRLGRNLVRIFGEPTPEQPRAKPASRKVAQSGELSGELKEEMRMQIVRGGTVSCPADDVPLDVIDATTMGDMGRSFLVHCPGCGFQAALPAPKRSV